MQHIKTVSSGLVHLYDPKMYRRGANGRKLPYGWGRLAYGSDAYVYGADMKTSRRDKRGVKNPYPLTCSRCIEIWESMEANESI